MKPALILLSIVACVLLVSCATLDRRAEIYALKSQIAELEARGADPVEIQALKDRVAELEDRDREAPWIDTGNPMFNQFVDTAMTLLLGYFGIRWWRGSPGARKGPVPPGATS